MVEAVPFIRWLHLVAAATWTGGLVVLAALIVALRRAGAERALVQVAARQFSRVSWAAMIVAVLTGLSQVHATRMMWSYGRLHIKIGLVAITILLAALHAATARRTSPAVRGIGQVLILGASLAIFAAAVAL